MTCAEFQRALPYIIETGGNAEQEAHLQSCHVCSDLVADLKYIAEAARLLVPMEDPNPRVWEGIQKSLEREGVLARPTGPRGRLLRIAHWATKPSTGMLVIVLVILAGIALYRHAEINAHPANAVAISASDQNDTPVLAAVAESAPSLRGIYEENFKSVDAYISDAKRHVEQDPGDEEAHQHLMKAYEQKTMMYRMALSASFR